MFNKILIVTGAAVLSYGVVKLFERADGPEVGVIAEDVEFFRHSNGLCFAMVRSRASHLRSITSIANIPCTAGDTIFVK